MGFKQIGILTKGWVNYFDFLKIKYGQADAFRPEYF